MKSEHSIRNRFRSKLLRCAAIGTLLFVCASAVPVPARLSPAALEVHADQLTNDKIKEKEGEIASTKKERSELESGLSNVKKIKAELEKNKSDLAAYITQLDGNLEEIQANIEALKEKIVEKEQQITETEAELEEAIAVQEAQYEAMKQRIRMMYLKGDTFYLDLLFSMEGSYGDMLNKAGYIEKIEEYDRNKLNDYMEQTRLVELTKESLEEEKVTLDEAKEAVEEEEANVKALLSEKEAQINAVNADIQTKEQSIAAYEADIAQRDFLRFHRGHRLGRNFAENDDEHGDDRCSDSNGKIAAEFIRHDRCNCRCGQIDNVVGNEYGGEHLRLLVLDEVECKRRPFVTVIGKTPQPETAHARERRLSR